MSRHYLCLTKNYTRLTYVCGGNIISHIVIIKKSREVKKKMKKRVILLGILGIASIACLTSCGGSDSNKNDEETSVSPITPQATNSNIAEYKASATALLNSDVTSAKAETQDTAILEKINTFYNEEKAYIDSIIDIDVAKNVVLKVSEDIKYFAQNELKPTIITLTKSIVDKIVNDYITDEAIKATVTTYYNGLVSDFDNAKTLTEMVSAIKKCENNIKNYVFTTLKNKVIETITSVVNATTQKIYNETVKKELTTYLNAEITKLNACTNLEEFKTVSNAVIEETTAHVKEVIINVCTNYLDELTKVESTSAYNYIPKSMQPSFASNIVSESNISYDFTNNTLVSSILDNAYGEQWQMVIENINQSISMAKVFNVAQTSINAATAAAKIYIENSYSDSINYKYTGAGYSAKLLYDGNTFELNINITQDITLPIFGPVKPKIIMTNELKSGTKTIYISVGEAIKTYYSISDNNYAMYTEYNTLVSENNVSRKAYLSISKNDDETLEGNIIENTTFTDKSLVSAVAQFYVNEKHLRVVGNKASGMVAFDGYIDEIYNISNGKLQMYEVQEQLTIAGVTGTYNTYWMDLNKIYGLTSIKVLDKTDDNESSKSTVDVYLNNSTTMLQPTYNKKIVKTSRKYDVELRKRYYYIYDSSNETYVVKEVEIPMMFVQSGDNYNSFVSDMLSDNNLTVSFNLDDSSKTELDSNYSNDIETFKTTKENIVTILDTISSKVSNLG